MAWYEDLAPCDYFGSECATCLRAIGWLEHGRTFTTGRVGNEVYSKLVELLKEPWQPSIFMGFHRCDLCQYDGESGMRNLFIPAHGVAFVAPELVIHYMNAHAYRPPDEFCAAVLSSPEMRSVPYLRAMLSVARPLMHASG
jgi:hypothetical protein